MMHGTCPKCGHSQKVTAAPGSPEFSKLVIRTASEVSGVPMARIRARHGTADVRCVRSAVVFYLRKRGLSWDLAAYAIGRESGSGAFSTQTLRGEARTKEVVSLLNAALGEGEPCKS